MYQRPEYPGKRCIAFRKTSKTEKYAKGDVKRQRLCGSVWKTCIIRCADLPQQGTKKVPILPVHGDVTKENRSLPHKIQVKRFACHLARMQLKYSN